MNREQALTEMLGHLLKRDTHRVIGYDDDWTIEYMGLGDYRVEATTIMHDEPLPYSPAVKAQVAAIVEELEAIRRS